MTLEELLAVAEIVEKLTNRYRDQEAAHKAALTEIRASFNARTGADEKLIEGCRMEIIRLNGANDRLNDLLRAERLAHRDEVAVLQERLRRVTLVDDDGSEPFDPPGATAKLAPKIGDTVRLVTHPERAQVAKHLRTALQWPWMPSWGLVGQTGKAVKPLVAVAGAVAVALDGSTIFARWPIDCLEVVAEATHDTEAGKASAESAVKTEPVVEEIKVGDVVKVRSASGDNTAKSDIGKIGEVRELDSQDGTVFLSGGAGWVSRCDIRKVTT